jgi:hypothetical protein
MIVRPQRGVWGLSDPSFSFTSPTRSLTVSLKRFWSGEVVETIALGRWLRLGVRGTLAASMWTWWARNMARYAAAKEYSFTSIVVMFMISIESRIGQVCCRDRRAVIGSANACGCSPLHLLITTSIFLDPFLDCKIGHELGPYLFQVTMDDMHLQKSPLNCQIHPRSTPASASPKPPHHAGLLLLASTSTCLLNSGFPSPP